MSKFSSYLDKQNGHHAVSEQLPGTKMNHGGGYVYTVSPLTQYRRFLVLGAESSYYRSESEMINELTELIANLSSEDSEWALLTLMDVYENSDFIDLQTVMYIAALWTNTSYASYMYQNFIPNIRNLSHFLLYMSLVDKMRGYGRGLRKAVNLYLNDKVSTYDALKYGSRWGMSVKDLIFKAHPKLETDLFNIFMGNHEDVTDPFVKTVLYCMDPNSDIDKVQELIVEHMLPLEMVHHSHHIKSTFEAVLPHMNFHAVLWNLGRMTHLKVFNDRQNLIHVFKKIHDGARHMNIYDYIKTFANYEKGQGRNLTWKPIDSISDALMQGFEDAVKRLQNEIHFEGNCVIAIDQSGSMASGWGGGTKFGDLKAGQLAGIVTYSLLPMFDKVRVIGYGRDAKLLPLSYDNTLSEVVEACDNQWGVTNPSSVMEYLNRHRLTTDTLIIITDNETNSGNNVEKYIVDMEKATGKPIKVIVLAMTASEFTTVPENNNRVNLPGFDSFKAFELAMKL